MTGALSRREILRRAGAAGLAAAGVAGVAAWLHRRPGWPPPEERVALPSWRAQGADEGARLVVARGTAPGALVEAALEELGGVERFVARGDVVLVKPNAAFDRPAWQGATANPEVVGAIVRACVRAGAAEVIVTDNPIHAPEGCFRKTGIGAAAEAAGGRVHLPRPSDFRPVALPGTLLDGWPVLVGPLARATKVIGIAPIKDHNLAKASLTLKNWYGLLGGPRNRLHQKMDETISTLSALVRPTLSVLDGSRIMVSNGPTGGSPADLRNGEVLAVSTDPVAVDAWGGEQLGLQPADLPYLGLAALRGAGTTDWRALDPREIQR
jgi:uncharacterized protein (DUF362 family)